ncbi:hypothetical protein [Marilutibacter alkalisoli]|uniref:Uncharacterized protein n=1 Tax=Marilutibacter alkalisoli TaxID=2591633 RepID=A0A514BR92_9GAMM|nr:hypothetical protein [Lysobacter alkalisoli]QDH69924.1 hypothetical protein FKV23_07330 [Lysobacter alkalisoli]
MPSKEFLEQYPLYRKFICSVPDTTDELPKPRINMLCPRCDSEQTFRQTNEYHETLPYLNFPTKGRVFRAVFLCSHCDDYERHFFIAIDGHLKWLMKVGQHPSWEIQGDPNIEKLLGTHSGFYRKGLVCESQGYGIGAFGYYRRIVEEVIDELLSEISGLLSGDELTRFSSALDRTRATIVTQEKIELVKDLLPGILRPDGMNPLSVLHSSLSEGLHAESDDVCLEQAAIVRQILVYLVNQVAASKATSREFTDSMRRLMEKKSAK